MRKYNRTKIEVETSRIIDFELNYDSGEMEYDFDKGIFVYFIEDEKAHIIAKEIIIEHENKDKKYDTATFPGT